MNGAGTRRGYGGGGGGYETGRLSPAQAVMPSGRAMMEGYRKDIVNGFEKEKPRYNPVRLSQT